MCGTKASDYLIISAITSYEDAPQASQRSPEQIKSLSNACSACTCLPLKCFQDARSLTSLLKSDCAAIDSLRSDKQLRAWTCQPVNHGSLTFPSALRLSPSPSSFSLHASKAKTGAKNVKLLTTRMHRKAQFARVLREAYTVGL